MSVRIATGSLIAAACAVGLALSTAPAAQAAVSKVEIASPGLSAKYGTTCSYEVTATVTTDNETVEFWEDNTFLGAVQPRPGQGIATFKWTPTGLNGRVTIFAAQPVGNGTFVPSAAVDVGRGTNLGSACLVS